MKFIDKIKQHKRNRPEMDFIILGSGASMNYFTPTKDFFDNKVIIGINTISDHYPCDYIIMQHHELLNKINPEYIELNRVFITRFQKGITDKLSGLITSKCEKDLIIFDHNNQTFLNDLDFSAQDDPDKLVIGGTTAIAAISLAVKLGAKNIFLCGIDGGSLDGETNLKGYYQAENPGNKEIQHNHSLKTNKLIMDFRDYLKTRGVNMFSINPFVNMTFEGHQLK